MVHSGSIELNNIQYVQGLDSINFKPVLFSSKFKVWGMMSARSGRCIVPHH